MGHKNIDIDAFGSALGMYRLCKTLEKDAYIVSEPKGKSLGKFLEILEKEEEYKDVIITEEKAKDLITENTLLIIVDTHKTSYVEFSELLEDFMFAVRLLKTSPHFFTIKHTGLVF